MTCFFNLTTSPTATTGDDDTGANVTGDGDTGTGKEATIFGETCVTFENNSALFKYFAKCLVLFVCINQK